MYTGILFTYWNTLYIQTVCVFVCCSLCVCMYVVVCVFVCMYV